MNRAIARARRHARGDEGASLVIVMIFIMAVGLVVASLLSYTQAGLVSAAATQSRHDLSADASAAMDVAINTVRNSSYADPATQSCPADGLTVPGAEGDVRVTCVPAPGTGVSAGMVPISALNRPGSAVLTLGSSAAETGFEKLSNGVLRIKGRVYVNDEITVAGAGCPSTNCSQISVDQAPVIVRGTCPAPSTNKVVSTESVTCSSPGSPPEGRDPATLTDADIANGSAIAAGYAQPPSGLADLVHRVPPACPASGTVELEPGYYDDAAALSALTGSSCSRPLHLRPGVYYLDFRNEDMAALPAVSRPVPAGSNVWVVNNSNARVVGGTRTSTGAVVIPGSCVSPLTTTSNNQGVQLVFGGSSRLDVRAGQVELCGQYHVDRPPLVVYGAKTGTTASVPLTGSTPTGAVTPVAAGETPFATPGAAAAPGGGAATVALTRPASGTARASLRLTGTSLAAQIPAGSVLVGAELRVTHRETTPLGGDALTVGLRPNPGRTTLPGPPAATSYPVAVSTAGATQVIPVLSTALVNEVWRHGLADLQVDYALTAAAASGAVTTATAELDGAQLWLTWRPPSLRGQATPIAGPSCIATAGSAGCPLIKTDGAQTKLYLQGTTYAPLARFDVALTNISGQVFKSGIIARALTLSITPSAGFVGPVIEVPEETGSGVNLDLFLSAYVCPAGASCPGPPPSSGWRRVGRSSVSLESTYPVPSNGARSVEVTSWQLLE